MAQTGADFGHTPVLLGEVLSFIVRPQTRSVLDATIGAGGHAEAILRAMDEVRLIGMDKDVAAIAIAKKRLAPFAKRATIAHGDFPELDRVLDEHGPSCVDAVILDLGVSSMQLDNPSRGFSFSQDGPLDMRMNPDSKLTAAELVNSNSEKELVHIFRAYGEERMAPRIARAIIKERARKPITSTARLAQIVAGAAPRSGKGRIHPATRIFQAIRIAVNSELEILEPALKKAVDRLNPGGRLLVISFHSLEDRIVKRTFATLAKDCVCPKEVPVCVCDHKALVKVLTKKPITPGEQEVNANTRARSSRLRVAERLAA